MINQKFNTIFTNSRMLWYEDEAELQSAVGFYGHIQQLGAEAATSLGIAWTKAYKVWCPIGTDIQEGDEIGEGGNTYNVKGVKSLDLGNNKHKELYVEKIESYG